MPRMLRYRRHSSWGRPHDAETVPLIQKIRKTVEGPQAQLTDMPVAIHNRRLGFRRAADRGVPTGPEDRRQSGSLVRCLCEIMFPWSRQRRTPLRSHRTTTSTVDAAPSTNQTDSLEIVDICHRL